MRSYLSLINKFERVIYLFLKLYSISFSLQFNSKYTMKPTIDINLKHPKIIISKKNSIKYCFSIFFVHNK